MTNVIRTRPMTAEAFAPFGDLLDAYGTRDHVINAGMCERFHDRARLDFGPGGRPGISIFDAVPRRLPYDCNLLERHPDGSQAFIPMTSNPFLVIVAQDLGGRPDRPLAFVTKPHQGINLHRGTWHGVLTPLHAPGLFAVVDRIGEGANLEEVRLDPPVRIVAG
ncbi:ureidoglycolate lyase [Sulfitobacter sp. LCG007]